MAADGALCIFVKNPVAGNVKTRLARTVGDDEALRIYQLLLRHTAAVARKSGMPVVVYYSDNLPDRETHFPDSDARFVQNGPDLGARMYNAAEQCLRDYDKVVIIGSDCGELKPNILRMAFTALDTVDIAIGPAEDGGYYLIGMTSPDPALFTGIDWSTPAVLTQTISKALGLGYDLALLPRLRDVDVLEDWLALEWRDAATK